MAIDFERLKTYGRENNKKNISSGIDFERLKNYGKENNDEINNATTSGRQQEVYQNNSIVKTQRNKNLEKLKNAALNDEEFKKYSIAGLQESIINNSKKPKYNTYKSPNQKRDDSYLRKMMSEEETDIYNYYLGKFGKEKAEEYYEAISEDINKRYAELITSKNKDNVLNQLIYGAAAGLENFKEGTKRGLKMLAGDDEVQPTTAYEYGSQMTRENLADSGPVVGGQSLGQVGYDLVTNTANMLPSMAIGLVTAGLGGSAAMGLSAAGNTYQQDLKDGYTEEEAWKHGALVGAAEGALQYILGGIGALGGKLATKTIGKFVPKLKSALARVAVKVPASMASEGFEEYSQEILDTVFRNWIFDENNDIDLLSEEAIYSGILGALTAGFIEGPSVAVNESIKADYDQRFESVKVGIKEENAKAETKYTDDEISEMAQNIMRVMGGTASEENIMEFAGSRDEKAVAERIMSTGRATSDFTIRKDAENYLIEQGVGLKERLTTSGKKQIEKANTMLAEKRKAENRDTVLKNGYTEEQVQNMSTEEVAQAAVEIKKAEKLSTDMQALSEAVKDQSEGYKQTLTKVYEDYAQSNEAFKMDAENFADEFSTFYDIGRAGVESIDRALEAYGKGNPQLTNALEQAYVLGRGEAVAANKANIENRQAEIDTKLQESKGNNVNSVGQVRLATETELKNPKLAAVGGKVVTKGKKLSKQHRAKLQFIREFSKLSGVNIVLFEGGKSWGWYDSENNEIFLNIEEGMSLKTLSHELTHFIQQHSPKHYEEFKQFLLDYYKENGKYQKLLEQAHAKQEDLSAEELEDEIIANACQMFISDTEAMQKLIDTQSKGLIETITRWFKDMCDYLRQAFENVKASHAAAQALEEDIEMLEKARDKWYELLNESITVNKQIGTNAKNQARNYDGSKQQFELKEYSAEEKAKHVADAKKYFGTTYNWNEAGYLLTDGSRLDFSGKKFGGSSGYRSIDHREIDDAFDYEYGTESATEPMIQFMQEGNIRIMPESGGMNIAIEPTKDQYDSLGDFISRNRGEVVLDLDDANGNTIVSAEYNKGTYYKKVIDDIKAYFESGTIPKGSESEIGKYRFEMKDSEGNELSPEQAEFFKNSKMRDENGRLKVMHHGTNSAGFTVFDPGFSDDGISLFFSDSTDVAGSYSYFEKDQRYNPYGERRNITTAEEFEALEQKEISDVGNNWYITGIDVRKIDENTGEYFRERRKYCAKHALAKVKWVRFAARDLCFLLDGEESSKDLDSLIVAVRKDIVKLNKFDEKRDIEDVPEIAELTNKISVACSLMEDLSTPSSKEVKTKIENYNKVVQQRSEEIWHQYDAMRDSQRMASICYANIGKWMWYAEEGHGIITLDGNETVRTMGDSRLIERATGTEKEVVAKALEFGNAIGMFKSFGNRYDVYLNIENPYVYEGEQIHEGDALDFTINYDGIEFEISAMMDEFGHPGFSKTFEDYFDAHDYIAFTVKNKDIADRILKEFREQYRRYNEGLLDEEELIISYDHIPIKSGSNDYWNNLKGPDGRKTNTRGITKYAKENGYDGVIFKNIYDNGGQSHFDTADVPSTIAVAFSSNQVKDVDNKAPTKDPDIRFEIKENFYKEYDAWDKKDTNKTFVVGITSEALKSVGVKEQNVVLRSGTVLQKIKNHKEMTFDKFREIPDLLEKPVIIQFSDAINPKTKKPKYESRITVLGEVYADGKPVLVSLELLPTNQKKTVVLDFAVITSAYKKEALQQYINENTILYIDPNKKRTDKWLSLNRLQLPLGENQYGSIRKIAYSDGKVKVQKSKNATAIQKAMEEAGVVDDYGNFKFELKDEDENRLEILENQEERLVDDLKTLEKYYGDAIRQVYEQDIKPNEGISKRAEELNRKAAKRFMNEVGAMFHVPKDTREEYLLPIINEIIDKGPAISDSEGLIDRLYQTAYEHTEDYIVDTDPEGNYKNLRDYIRKTSIFVNAGTKADVGDYNNFRKRNMGSLRLTNDQTALGLDEFYEEVSNPAPEIFTGTTDGAEQLYELSSFMKDRGRTESIGDFMPQAEYTAWADETLEPELNKLFDSTIGSFLSEPTRKEKERQRAAKVDRAMENVTGAIKNYKTTKKEARAEGILIGQIEQGKKDAAEMRRMQESFERKAKNYEDMIEAKREKIKEIRQRRDEILAERAEAYRKYREERTESIRGGAFRKRIERNAKTLGDWLLKNSDKEHVPEALKTTVGEFLTSIDFTSKRALGGGEETQKDMKFGVRLNNLAYILKSQQDYMNGANKGIDNPIDAYLDLPEGFVEEVSKLAKTVIDASENRGFTVNEMNSEQLAQLDKMLRVLKTSIGKMNKLLANAHFASATAAAESSMRELADYKNHKLHGKNIEQANAMLEWGMFTPVYAFERYGKAGASIFEGIQKGWNDFAFAIKKILNFTKATYTDKEVSEWGKEVHTVTLASGKEIKITTAQLMSFYCLLKREQARGHIFGGGVRIADIAEGKEKIQQTDNFLISEEDVQTLYDELTPRQIDVANKLQKFMTEQGSEWGNKVSMERFGYRAFTEENYFPIETDDNNRIAIDPEAKANDMFRLLNMSATKGLVKGANNALVVSDIFDVFSNHMSDMAKYGTLALPILDTMKWYNYKVKYDQGNGQFTTETVQKSVERVYGSVGKSYFTNFMKDLNGVKEGGRGTNFLNKLTSNYKIAAVGFNLRTAALQPTSIIRALDVIEHKYLVGTMHPLRNAKEAEKYSGIALWKSLGFYNTDIARGIREQIKGGEPIDKIRDKSMWFAEQADRATWGVLWNAAKLKAKDQGFKGEELNRKAAEIFDEIIYKTQVVDSTLTRSELMRNKNVNSFTAFMAEPTISYNMVADSVFNIRREKDFSTGWKKYGNTFARSASVYMLSTFITSAVQSIADAMRDDDDDENAIEKFWQAFYGEKFIDGNFVAEFNPLEKIPFVRDAFSTLRGYGNERMETSAISSLVKACEIIRETYRVEVRGEKTTATTYYGKMTGYGKAYATAKAISQLSGLPFSNAMREGVTLWNLVIGSMAPSLKVKTYDDSKKK